LDAAGKVLATIGNDSFYVVDEPVVTSDGVYPLGGTGGGPGVPGTFTVTPRFPQHATAIRWRASDGEQTFTPVDSSGMATVTWTPEAAGPAYFWFSVQYDDSSFSSYNPFDLTVERG
jgi:hypothetical protein